MRLTAAEAWALVALLALLILLAAIALRRLFGRKPASMPFLEPQPAS